MPRSIAELLLSDPVGEAVLFPRDASGVSHNSIFDGDRPPLQFDIAAPSL